MEPVRVEQVQNLSDPSVWTWPTGGRCVARLGGHFVTVVDRTAAPSAPAVHEYKDGGNVERFVAHATAAEHERHGAVITIPVSHAAAWGGLIAFHGGARRVIGRRGSLPRQPVRPINVDRPLVNLTGSPVMFTDVDGHLVTIDAEDDDFPYVGVAIADAGIEITAESGILSTAREGRPADTVYIVHEIVAAAIGAPDYVSVANPVDGIPSALACWAPTGYLGGSEACRPGAA